MTSYTNVFSNHLVLPSQNPYLAYTLNSIAVPFAWSNDFGDNTLVVSNLMNITPTANGYSILMPDATQVSPGTSFCVNNVGGFPFSILKNDLSLLATVTTGNFQICYVTDNSTASGVWSTVNTMGGAAINSITIDTSATQGNILVDPGTITSNGTFAFSLGADLFALSNFAAGTGFAVRTAVDTWILRTLTATARAQIAIANPDGVANNPQFELNQNLIGASALTSIQAGNIAIGAVDANTISSVNPTNDIKITPYNAIPSTSNGSIILGAVSPGNTKCLSDFQISGGDNLILQDSSLAGHTISLKADSVAANYTIILPNTIPTLGQVASVSAVAGNVATLAWANAATTPGLTVANTVPIYTNASGGLGDSVVYITNAFAPGNATGGLVNNISNVATIGVSNLALGQLGPNTISSTAGNIFFDTAGAGFIGDLDNHTMLNQKALQFCPTNNPSTGFTVGFQAPALLAANITWTLPTTDGTANQVLSTSGTGGGSLLSWVDRLITWTYAANPQLMVINNGYIATLGVQTVFNMPAAASIGAVFEIAGYGAGGWQIVMAAGQAAHSPIGSTTIGGTITSSNQFSSIRIVCVDSGVFTVISFTGTPAFA